MAVLKPRQESRTYLSIGQAGDGKTYLKQQVEEGTVGAIKRDWSVNGESGTKYELCYPSIEGKISGIEFVEKEFNGKKHFDLALTFDNEIVVSTKSTSKFGSAIMRQLPNLDLTKEFSLAPYSYIPKGKDKESVGVSMKQGGGEDNRVSDFFFDFETKESKNGIPEATFDWSSVEDWEKDKFWSEVDKFLRSYVEENVTPNVPVFVAEAVEEAVAETVAEVQEEVGSIDDF